MHRKLTITLPDDVYQGLHRTVGRGHISSFIARLVRPHVAPDTPLELAYRAIAEDEAREREAHAWVEAAVDEGLE